MNKNILLLGLMLGALFFLKRQPGGQPVQGQMESGVRPKPAFAIDQWWDEG